MKAAGNAAAQILKSLYCEYKSEGPPALKSLAVIQQETGLDYNRVTRLVRDLAKEELARYWELGDVAGIGPKGIEICRDPQLFSQRFPGVPLP